MRFTKSIYNTSAIAIFLVATSCGSNKALTSGEASNKISAKNIIKNHYNNTLQFKTIRGRLKVDFKDKYTDQSFGLSLRMEKDKAIWLSATLSVVKAYITPDRVTFYNKLDNTYFDGDFSYLSKLLGTELNFEKVQNILLGQAIFNLKDETYHASVVNNAYQLLPKKDIALFKKLFLIEPSYFKMASQQISQPIEARQLQVDYDSYQEVSGRVLPQKINVLAQEASTQTKIAIEYRNITFDEKVTFPYKIPNGFKEIVLE
jgi:hypothetical protein